MMLVVRRIPVALLIAGAVFLLMTFAYWAGVSLAQAQGLEPPVIHDPGRTVDQVTKLWRSGAITAALIVGSCSLLMILRYRVQWLQEGKRAAYVAAVIGALGTLVDAINRGSTPTLSMVVVSIALAIALVRDPIPKPVEAPTAKPEIPS
ncbi:MAG: hypothetical protein AB7O24_01145 [Kofleriaceae bacterium]